MTREAILHIGHKKTGTTAIQHAFSTNRAALLARGVLYPLDEANHSFALSGLFRGHNRAQPASGKELHVRSEDALRLRLEQELQDPSWSQLVFSAEVLAGFKAPQLTALRDWLAPQVDTIRVVFVLRDPVDWSVSVAQQHLKSHADIDALIADPEPVRWRRIVQRLRKVFGADALTLLEYEALAAVRERFVARFATAVGLPGKAAMILRDAQGQPNEALSAEAAAMLARFNARVPEEIEGKRNPARSGIETKAFTGLAGRRFDLPHAARQLAHERSREDVAFVAREFGITRYDYPASAVTPAQVAGAESQEFLDSVADRLAMLNNRAEAAQMLIAVYMARLAGRHDLADARLRNAVERFPTDDRVIAEAVARDAGNPNATADGT